MLKWVRNAVISAAILSLTAACAPNGNNGAMDGNGVQNNTTTRQFGVNDGNRNNGRFDMNNWNGRTFGNTMGNGTRLHNNSRVDLAEDVARQISAMNEVDQAHVFLTDRNAYVAVVLNDKAGNRGTVGNRGITNNRRSAGIDRELNNNGTDNMRGTTRNGASFIGNTGNTRNMMNNRGTTGNMGMDTRDRGFLGLKDNMMGNRGQGNGMFDDNRFNNNRVNDGVTNQLKARIAQKVRQLKPNVNNVYVSANPDFVARMQGYADQVTKGDPIRGFVDEFNMLVERIFPTNALDNNMNNTDRRNDLNRTRTNRMQRDTGRTMTPGVMG